MQLVQNTSSPSGNHGSKTNGINECGLNTRNRDFRPFKRQRSMLPPATKVVSEGFIEVVFLFLGIGVLLPWNAYISAKHYFTQRLCDEDTGRPVLDNIEGYFSVIYNGACVLSLAVVIVIQYLADDDDQSILGYDTTTARKGESEIHTRPTASSTSSSRRKLLKKSSSLTVSAILHNTTNLYSPMLTQSLRFDRSRGSSNYTWYMVMLPLAAYLAVFCLTTVLVFVPDIPPRVFAVFTLSGLFICGVCTAAASSGIVGTAGLFDSSIGVNPYFNGQAVGGLLVAVANLFAVFFNGSADFFIEFCGKGTKNDGDGQGMSVSISISDQESIHQDQCVHYSEISWATAGYFAMSCLILSICMLGYSYVDEYKKLVRRNSNTVCANAVHPSAYRDDASRDADNDESVEYPSTRLLFTHLSIDAKSVEDASSDGSVDDTEIETTGHDLSKWQKRASVSFPSYQNGDPPDSFRFHVNNFDRQSGRGSEMSENTQQSLTASIWHSVKGTATCLFLLYFCTLGIFPVWTTELISVHRCESPSRFQNDLFTPLSFVIFNAGDLIGRAMSSAIDLTKAQDLSSKLVWGSMLRVTFFGAFLFCQAKSNRLSAWVIQNDWFSWSLQFVFAWTNGFMTSVAFCYAPTIVENKTNPQQIASAILNFALSFGLLVGSFFAGPYLSVAGNHIHGHP